MSGSPRRATDEPPVLRLATAADATSIAAMSRDTIEQGLGWTWTTPRVLRAMRHRATNVLVAHRDGRLLGFGIMSYDDDKAHLLLFAVHPLSRRSGLGKTMLQWLEECAVTAGIACVQVEARALNQAAIGFYQANGYRERRRVKGLYRGIEDGIRFEKIFWPEAAVAPAPQLPRDDSGS